MAPYSAIRRASFERRARRFRVAVWGLRSFFVFEMRKRVDSLFACKSSSDQLSILHKMKGSAGVFASTDAVVQGTKMRSYICEQYEACKKSAGLLCKNDIGALHSLLDEIEKA